MGSSTRITDGGRKVALDGDEATCGECKGTHRILGTGMGISDKGRKVVVDGDSALSKGTPCEAEGRKRYPARYSYFDSIAK
jgi:hypothetical protein